MVVRELNDFSPLVCGHKGPTITDVGHIADVTDNENHYSAAATPLNATLVSLTLAMSKF